MTVVCKKRSRLSGRPQASFGSLFTSILAPAINAGASVLDSSLSKHAANKQTVVDKPDNTAQTSNNDINTNIQTDNVSTPKADVESIKSLNVPNHVEKPLQFNQENIQSDPTKARLGTRIGKRHKCWIGAAIGAATSIAGSLFGAAAQKKEMRRQKSIQDWQNTTQEASAMTTALNNSQDYQEAYLKQFRTAARLGKSLGNSNIVITDGGDAQQVDNNTFILRGGSHEDINETGQTGIGINVGGNQIEAEGGEVAQKKDGALRIFSAQPILGNGMSPAQAILRGYNKDKVFAAQQRFKRNNHLKDDGSKLRNGGKVRKDNYYDWMSAVSSNLGISPIDGTYDYRDYYNSVTPYERSLMRYAPQGTHFTDIGKRPNHATFSNESKYSNSKTPGGNWDGNVFVPSIWQFGNNGNKIRNKYMNNTGEGYFNGRINVFPRNKYGLGGVRIGSNIGINTNTNIPDYNSAYINWLISQLSSEKDEQQVANYNQEDIDNAVNAANLAYQNYLIRQLPSGKSNKQEDSKTTKHITADELKRNTQSVVDTSRRSVDFASNTYRSKLISQLPNKQDKTTPQYNDKRSLKDKTQSIVDATRFAVDNAIKYRNSKLISQLPNKQNTKEDNKKEKNKVVKHQVKTTPQYKGNVTKGNYQLHDGESKTINGIKYTRIGNTIINHKTNVGYIYDKNGNYTGQADYSKVGNFNQAFDAARAAGRSNFIYRAGKYNNYSTAKETNAKKERLNRIVGAKRIAKRYGGIASRPVKGMYGVARPKAWGGKEVKDKGGITPWTTSNHYNVQYPYAITDSTLTIPYVNSNNKDNYDYDYDFGNALGDKEVAITAKRITPTYLKPNNDALNLINTPKTEETKKEEVPYIPQTHNRSRTIFSGGDYLGLGIDTLAALSTGLVNYNTAGKYVLPDRAPIIQASKLPTTYNIAPEIEETKRYRDRLTGETFNNTSSSVAALNRSNAVNLNALSNLSKLWATKENEENKMLTEDAKNQQAVAIQNTQNELARQSEIARIKNEAIQAKGDALNVGLSGLSQAWTNFWTAGRTAYEDDQTRRAVIASSKEASPTRLSEIGYELSPDVLASLYQTSTDDKTKRFYLSRLSPKQRIKYGIN